MNYRYIFWDNDGVLVDTERYYLQASREALAKINIELSNEQFAEISLAAGCSIFDIAVASGVTEQSIADLKEWRLQQGLSPHPDIAIISGSLRFPIPDVLTAAGRNLVIFTTAGADPERVAEIESQSCQVVVASVRPVLE